MTEGKDRWLVTQDQDSHKSNLGIVVSLYSKPSNTGVRFPAAPQNKKKPSQMNLLSQFKMLALSLIVAISLLACSDEDSTAVKEDSSQVEESCMAEFALDMAVFGFPAANYFTCLDSLEGKG